MQTVLLPLCLGSIFPEQINTGLGGNGHLFLTKDLTKADFCQQLSARQYKELYELIILELQQRINSNELPDCPLDIFENASSQQINEWHMILSNHSAPIHGDTELRSLSLRGLAILVGSAPSLIKFLLLAEDACRSVVTGEDGERAGSRNEEIVDFLLRFSEMGNAQSIRTSDVRFGRLLRAARMHTSLKHDASFSEITRQLVGRYEELSDMARAILEQLRLLAIDINIATGYSLSREIQDIALSIASVDNYREVGESRDMALALGARYGLLGDAFLGYEPIGKRLGMSGRNARNVVYKLLEKCSNHTLYAPASEALIDEIRGLCPISLNNLERNISARLGQPLSLKNALRFINDILKIRHDIEFISPYAGYAKIACLSRQRIACEYVCYLAIKMVSNLGAGQIHWLGAQAGDKTGVTLDVSSVTGIIVGHPAFEWLSEEDGWFWFGIDDTRNYIINILRKIYSVCGKPASVVCLETAISRGRGEHSTLRGSVALPATLLKTMISRFDQGWPDAKRKDPLSCNERLLVGVLREKSGKMFYASLREALVESGKMKRVTLDKLLNHSPIIERVRPGLYRIAGGQDEKHKSNTA